MNSEKGEAAFDSVDDVLAKETVSAGTSGSRGRRKKNASEQASPENPPAGNDRPEAPRAPAGARKRNVIVAACIGLAVLVLGCLCIAGFGKSCRR